MFPSNPLITINNL